MRLKSFPVLLGDGERLVGKTGDTKPMRLVDTQTVGDGIAILTYEAVRDAERTAYGAGLRDSRAAALHRAGIQESAQRAASGKMRAAVLTPFALRLAATSWPARSRLA